MVQLNFRTSRITPVNKKGACNCFAKLIFSKIYFVRLLFCNLECHCLILTLIVFGCVFSVVAVCCDCDRDATTALAALMAVCLFVRPLCFVRSCNEVGPTEGRVTRHEKCQWLVTRQALYG